MVKHYFLTVHQATLVTLRNASLSNCSESILGSVRGNLQAVFALGFHMDSILFLHSCCGTV